MSVAIDRIEEAASAWDARIRGAKTNFRDRSAFQAWLAEDPAHQLAYDRLQAMLASLRANAELPELSALRDEARGAVHDSRRRRIRSSIAVAVAAMLLLTLGMNLHFAGSAASPGDPRIYSTSLDERTKVTLADGSVVTLDASTRLSARLTPARREITLLAGRALFQVAKDRARPFVVKAGDRTITALGTVFDVRLSPRELRVTLAEGSVAVRAIGRSSGVAEQILKPRQQLVEATDSASPELLAVDPDKELSWADGQLFFENEPLADTVRDMNRYSAQKILVDPAVANLRINGMFRTGNEAEFLDALTAALPVDIRHDEQGRIVVSPRPDSTQSRQR